MKRTKKKSESETQRSDTELLFQFVWHLFEFADRRCTTEAFCTLSLEVRGSDVHINPSSTGEEDNGGVADEGEREGLTTQHLAERSCLVEEAEDLATGVPALRLVVVHDAVRGGEDEAAELTRGEKVLGPVLNAVNGDIEAGRDDAALVDATVEVNNDLPGALVVDDLELVEVADT
jgi:hypothetical protein